MAPCPTHPGVESVGTCARCGRFYCAAEVVELDAQRYCGDCGVRPDVDWLGQHYRKLEGVRSGLAWFLFVAGLLVSLGAVAALLDAAMPWSQRAGVVGVLVYALTCMAVLTGQSRVRFALVASSLLVAVLFALGSGDPLAALAALPLLILAAAVWTDVRTRLFFRLPVPREALRKHYRREGSNPLAITASRLSFLSLFVPGVGLVSLGLGIMAVARVDSKALPPVGNLSAALTAVVFSLFTSLMWGLTLFAGR